MFSFGNVLPNCQMEKLIFMLKLVYGLKDCESFITIYFAKLMYNPFTKEKNY